MNAANLAMLTGLVIPLAGIAMIVAIVWFVNVTRRREIEHRADVLRHLVDKFPSGDAFVKAMQGPEGQRLAETLSMDHTRRKRPGWVGLFVGGAILACLGVGFFVLAAFVDDDFVVPGAIVFALGTGLLLSSYVARRAEQSETGRIDQREMPEMPGREGPTPAEADRR